MTKQILLSCFNDGITTVIADMARKSNTIKVAAGFTVDSTNPETYSTGIKWLHFGRDITTYRNNMSNIDIIVNLAYNSHLAEIAQIAVHYQKPLICVATNLTSQQQEILHQAARYIPVIYYKNNNENLAQIMDYIIQLVKDSESLKITGEIIKSRIST